MDKQSTIVGEWDVSREKLTLGGLLIFRQELEMLAFERGVKKICARFVAPSGFGENDIPQFVSQALSSQYQFLIEKVPTIIPDAWPVQSDRDKEFFSYQSFSRVILLWKKMGRFPKLLWDYSLVQRIRMFRNQFKGKVFTIHLKRVSDNVLDSNADLNEWELFFKHHAILGKINFVILGSDVISESISKIPGVFVAESYGLSLSEQLALVSISDGFLGMASGICQSAILSEIPYVVFKHPQHHVDEMKRELGEVDGFPFTLKHQKILRVPATAKNIGDTFQLIG